MRTLQECLNDHDTTMLRAIAERRGAELTTSRQPEMAEELARVLLQPESIREALEWLTGEERQALDTLMLQGGQMRIHRFEQQAGKIRRFGPGSLAREAPWRTLSNPAEGLWYRGLIARSFAQEAGLAVEFVFVPTDLRPLLPPPRTSHPPFEISQTETPHTIKAGGTDAVDDVCALLSWALDGTLHQHGGQLAQDTMAQARTQFLDPDAARPDFLLHLARSAGLLRIQGRSAQLAREQARDWLKQSRAQQLRVLQEAWRGDAAWNDLWRVPSIRCEETGWHNDPVAGRAAALHLVGRCPIGTWLSIPGFVDTVREHASDYLRPNGDFESWYIRDARSGVYLMGFDHWNQVEGTLLTYLLSGPLHWLGLVSLGYREGWEKPTAYRITAWGATLLGLPHEPLDDSPAPPARVSPDATVTIAREASLSDRFQLARIAEWRASKPAYVYAITPTSLGRALGADIQVERIEHFLGRISGDSVPAAAMARIRGWSGRYGHVRLRRAVVLETRSPQVMAKLRAHGRIRGYVRQALSPTTALVREGDWDNLVQELHRAGYLPEIMDR